MALTLIALAAAVMMIASAAGSAGAAAPKSTSSFTGSPSTGSGPSSFTGSGTVGGSGGEDGGSGSDDSGLGGEGEGGGLPGLASIGASGVAGMTVASVRRLQTDLARLGYFRHVVTGFYGAVTTAAVRRFQRSAGLRPDGIWGPRSAAALNRRLPSR